MAGDREKRKEELNKIIESIDSGVIQVTIHKGMAVKIRLVSHEEITIGGGQLDKIDSVTWFNDRIWWNKE